MEPPATKTYANQTWGHPTEVLCLVKIFGETKGWPEKVENKKKNHMFSQDIVRLKFVEIRGTLTHPEVLHHGQKVFKQIGRLSIRQRNQLKGEMLHISIRPWRFYSNKKIRKLIFFQVFPSSFWCTFEPPLSDAPQSSHRSFANPSPEKYHPETEENLPWGKASLLTVALTGSLTYKKHGYIHHDWWIACCISSHRKETTLENKRLQAKIHPIEQKNHLN